MNMVKDKLNNLQKNKGILENKMADFERRLRDARNNQYWYN